MRRRNSNSNTFIALLCVITVTLAGCTQPAGTGSGVEGTGSGDTGSGNTGTRPVAEVAPNTQADADGQTATGDEKEMDLEKITLGAGCFWCIEAVLLRVKGVQSVASGYMGGQTADPTYEQICTGRTGHAEVVEVAFDPQEISFEQLLDVFWQLHDPTTLNRQGADTGTQYRSAIFYHNDAQRDAAEASKKKWDESGKYKDPIVTEITAASQFYKAEAYHQDYFNKNPGNPYCNYNIPPKLKKLGLLK